MGSDLPVRIGLLALFVLITVSFMIALVEGSITTEYEGYLGSAGDDVEILISVTNDGNASDTAAITVDDTNGWPVAVPVDFNIDAGETLERTVTISIPEDALATEPNTVDITYELDSSGETGTDTVQIDVEQVFDINASLFGGPYSAAPGRSYLIHLMLTNNGNGDDLVAGELYAPKGPAGQGLYDIHHETFSVLLSPAESKTMIIMSTISRMADPGNETFRTIIYANSSGGNDDHELFAEIGVDDHDTWIRNLNATMESHGEVVGESITATAKFGTVYANANPLAPVANLTVSVHSSAAKGKEMLDSNTTSALIKDFDADTLIMSLDYPTTDYDDYVIRATVEYLGTTWDLVEETITLVEPEFAFDLRCLDDEVTLAPDDDMHTFDVAIENTGNVADTYTVDILSETPPVLFNNGQMTITLEPNEEVHIYVTFDPSIQMGRHVAQVRVVSQGSSAEMTEDVEANVAEAEDKEGGPFGDIPTDIVVGAIVAGALMFFFFGTEIGWLSLLAFVPLYYRVTGKQVLDNYVRGKIHGYVIANPGDHYNGIKGHLGINNGTLAYHLKVLERENYLKSRMDGKYKRYYPYESMIPSKKKLSPIQKLIVEKLKNNPGVSQRKLGKLSGESVQVVNYHMKQLEDAGVVEIEKLGNRSKCYVCEGWK